MKEIKIIQGTPNDDWDIRNLRRATWFDTYPNEEFGVTVEDVESEFVKTATEEGRKKSFEEHKGAYSDPNFTCILARDGDKLVGFLMGKKFSDANRLLAIYVLPDYQGRGIGARLFEKGLEWFDPAKDILVNVVSYNKKAQEFYKRMGFEFTGRDATDVHEALPTGKVLPEIEMVRKSTN